MGQLIALIFSITVCAAATPAAAADSDNATFGGHGAFLAQVAPGRAAGTPLLDTGFSDPAGAYDTVMINGEMPGAVAFRLCVKSAGACEQLAPSKQKVFPNGRFWAKFTLPAQVSAQFRVTAYDEGGAAAGKLVMYGAEAFVDKRAPVPQPSADKVADPAPYTFPLVTRADWGAADPTADYTPQTPVKFTLHHTAGKFTGTLEESKQEVLFDQDYHQNKNGWIDIGYHFIVDPQGNIFEGRPVTAVGAHVEGYNTGNVGISVMGYYHEPVNDQPTAAEMAAVEQIGAYLRDNYGIKASAFYAHRELNSTACPGDLLYAKKAELKAAIFPAAPKDDGDRVELPALPPESESLRQLLSLR